MLYSGDTFGSLLHPYWDFENILLGCSGATLGAMLEFDPSF